jgi:hypothetical protein
MTYPDNYKSACWRRKILSAHLTVVRVVYGIGIGRENLIQEVEDTVHIILALFFGLVERIEDITLEGHDQLMVFKPDVSIIYLTTLLL